MQKISLVLILLSTFAFTNALWPIYFYNNQDDECEEAGDYNPSVDPTDEYLDQPIDMDGYGTITCYCHSSDSDLDLYSIGDNLQIAGGIELAGSLDDAGQFYPQGFEGQDISTLQNFIDMCNSLFPVCESVGGCWADKSPN